MSLQRQITFLRHQLASEAIMVESIYQYARIMHPARDVDAVIHNTEPYYIIPPDMIWVTCEICRDHVPIDCIAMHIASHRGLWQCSYDTCIGRRFQTYRGYKQHLRITHQVS